MQPRPKLGNWTETLQVLIYRCCGKFSCIISCLSRGYSYSYSYSYSLQMMLL